MPAHLAHAQTTWGLTSAFENPQFSTAIGLVKYAQVDASRPAAREDSAEFSEDFSAECDENNSLMSLQYRH